MNCTLRTLATANVVDPSDTHCALYCVSVLIVKSMYVKLLLKLWFNGLITSICIQSGICIISSFVLASRSGPKAPVWTFCNC